MPIILGHIKFEDKLSAQKKKSILEEKEYTNCESTRVQKGNIDQISSDQH